MSATTLVRCACDHCNCSFESSQGYRYEGQLYCSKACATHDHAHPSPCCVASHCCQQQVGRDRSPQLLLSGILSLGSF